MCYNSQKTTEGMIGVMKKVMVLFLAGVAVACTALAGCQGASDTIEETESVSQEESAEPEEEEETEEYELPEGFSVLTDTQAEELVELFGDDVADDIIEPINAVISELGIEAVEYANYGNYNSNISGSLAIITMECYMVTDTRNLIFSITHAVSDWSVSFVKDADAEHYYWIDEALSEAVDLYDYSTGELISEKTKSTDEIQVEVDKSLEEAEEEFDEALDGLAEEVTQ